MATKKKAEAVTVSAPNIQGIQVRLVGDAPYMQARFSEKAMKAMADKMTQVSKPGSKKAREARDFNEDFEQAKHVSTEGWIGVPASSIRAALISACRLTGFTMTRAKLSIFVPPQGFDKVDGLPLIRIYGTPEPNMQAVRNATGVFDLRNRPMWKEWYIEPVITYDADQFSLQDVLNLLRRVGLQVGLGEGRPDSRSSAGLGFGTFTVEEVPAKKTKTK
jgi:hypothetical protein